MNVFWIPIVSVVVISMIPISIVTVTQIVKYKLKVEQIKADAMVRAEEVRARNQLEIEKLFYQSHKASTESGPANSRVNTEYDPSYMERPPRNRESR